MADLTPFIPAGRQVVEQYRRGGFKVSGVGHEGSILVTPERTVPWPATSLDTVDVPALAALLAGTGTELVLLGGGAGTRPLPPAVRAAFKAAGLAVEPMATAAACRTYNVLMAEGRPVAAALIAL